MSTGQAVTMPEGSFPDVTKSPLVFGCEISVSQTINVSANGDGNISKLEAKENSCVVQNHVGKEKNEDSLNKANCIQVFSAAKVENINNFEKLEAGKTKTLVNNVEHKHQHPMSVGASGDGPTVHEKLSLMTRKPETNHYCEAIDEGQTAATVSTQPKKPKQIFKKPIQSYAKAAQSLPAGDKLEGSMKHAQKNAAITITTDTSGNKLVNGCSEQCGVLQTESAISKECGDHSERRQKALRETTGHTGTARFTGESSSKSSEAKSADADLDSPKADNTLDENKVFTAGENSITATDGDNGSKLNNAPRREAEKPPRMQKQRSQDRMLSKQQRNSFDADSKRENFSRGSSNECLDNTGVDVQEFLINVLQTCARDRAILLKIEHDMMAFVNDKTTDFMKFPPMSSYHRMLVHRVATLFCLDHNVDETGKCVIINKTSFSRLPDLRFADQFDPRQCDPSTGRRDDDMRRSILKRSNQPRSFDRDDQRGGSWKDRQMSIEEREENYEKTRARIFNDAEANMNPAAMYGRRGVGPMQARVAYGERRSASGGAELESGARMPNQDSLTTRANSYSAISVLPRNSSYNSLKSGSSNSVSSLNGRMRGGYGRGRHHVNMHPRPPTPNRRDTGGNTYYYMQNQNQEVPFDAVEDDIAQSWFPDSPEMFGSECNTDTTVSTDMPILLAVPYGTTLPPETVLCHPITGLPYLSPDGYQLVYPSGMPGSNGLPSQYPRYYQMHPPPQTRPHGMPYPQAYNPYDESTHKSQGINNPEYAMIPPSYPPPVATATTTVFSGIQGQHNVNYAYQPAIYRPATDPAMQVNSTQPMQACPPQQGKQTPVMQGNQSFVQQTMPTSNYPPPYMTAPPGNQTHSHQTGIKDVVQPMNSTNNNLQRGVITQPIPVIPAACPPPASFNNQNTPQMNSSATNEKFRQKKTAKDKPPTTNPSQKAAADELGEKMQAIVLKNLQQQQSQIPEATKTDPKSTVTTALSTPNHLSSTHNTKRGQDPAQNSIPSDAPVSNQIVPHRTMHKNHGHQYQYANGIQAQQQQMHIYMMPTNNPAGNSSYQTFPQYMAQPQPQPVVGPGMRLFYLGPSQVVGMDGPSNLPTPGNVHMYHPSQMAQQQMQAQHPPYEGAHSFASNMNNNNAANVTAIESARVSHDRRDEVNLSKNAGADAGGTVGTSTSANIEGSDRNEKDEAKNAVGDKSEVDSNKMPQHEAFDRAGQTIESGLSESAQVSSTSTTHASNVTNQVYVPQNHPIAPQHHGTPLLVSNVPQDYRLTGINMAGPVAYPAGVMPKYPVYPNASYMYLPAASTARNAKLQEMKMYQTQQPQPHSTPLMAVQLPNQSSIQLVPAPSIQQQNAVYYAPPSYVATDYSHQGPAPQAPNHNHISSEVESQHDLSLQQSNNITMENKALNGSLDSTGTTEKASKDDGKVGDGESVAGKQ